MKILSTLLFLFSACSTLNAQFSPSARDVKPTLTRHEFVSLEDDPTAPIECVDSNGDSGSWTWATVCIPGHGSIGFWVCANSGSCPGSGWCPGNNGCGISVTPITQVQKQGLDILIARFYVKQLRPVIDRV